MDLIDKKLSEKLKLFEYIDKKYGTNIDESNTKKRETTSNTGSKDFFQMDKDINLNNELYDNIYSDFKTNSYKSYFYSPSVNTIDSNVTKHYSKLNNYKYSKKNSHNYKNHNLSRDRNLLTHENRTTINRSKSNTNIKKNISKLQPPNDSGNRLYNYGYYIKNKLNKKRKLEEEKARKQMIPKILNRSKEIKRDSNFEERLYYAEKNDTNDNIYNRKRTLSRDNINYQKHKKSIFTYHPKINKKSLLIASKLEPSTLRINRKKTNYSNYVEEKTVIDYYSNLFKDKNNFNYRKNKLNNNISPTCGNEKSNELYIKGMQDLKRKEQTYIENQQKKNEEYKNYPFKPKISKNHSSVGGGMKIESKKKSNKEDIYKKNKEWKKRVENENISKKKKYEEIENKKYTFKPEINQLNIQNDVPFIMKNIQQMNEYVNKRRKILEQKKEEENYKKRKLGLNAINYNVRTTIPKEFDLKTEKRNKSNKKERDLNIIKRQEKKNEKINNQAIIMANNITIKNNNNGLSYLNRDILNEDCKNNFNNKITNFNCSITQSQQDFINAVNDLHYTIDKLNI